jgi:hypothetical protein
MTGRPSEERQLAAGLREYLPVADPGLHQRIRAEIATTPQDRRRPSILGRLADADQTARRRTLLLVALLGAALTISVAAVAGALLREGPRPEPPVQPAPASLEPAPSSAAEDPSAPISGWPSTSKNEAGLYSWDGARCASSSPYCNVGFMHNGYGSGDVDIRIAAYQGKPIGGGEGVPVTIAGHDAIHRRINDRVQEWFVDVDTALVTIRLEAEPGTSSADLAEAEAIISSMRTEATGGPFGFRIVFRLPSDDWDSG